MLRQNKAVVLLFVLGTILVVVILANVVLRIMLNQSRLTHHQVSRIQAYYAAHAGIVDALEKLRTGDYVLGTHCTEAGGGCSYSSKLAGDDYVPFNINTAIVYIKDSQSTTSTAPCYNAYGDACVSATVAYSND